MPAPRVERTFTSRGRAFLATGITAIVCGVLVVERDLVRAGIAIYGISPGPGVNQACTQLRPALDKLNGVVTMLDNRKERLQEAVKRLSQYAMALGDAVGSGPFFKAHIVNLLPGQFAIAVGIRPDHHQLTARLEQQQLAIDEDLRAIAKVRFGPQHLFGGGVDTLQVGGAGVVASIDAVEPSFEQNGRGIL